MSNVVAEYDIGGSMSLPRDDAKSGTFEGYIALGTLPWKPDRDAKRTVAYGLRDWLINFMDGITTISSLLVVAAYPLVTQTLTESSLTTKTASTAAPETLISLQTVGKFAAISVGLFITLIVFCLSIKLQLQLEHGQQADPMKPLWGLAPALIVIIAGLLTAALVFFFLTIIAYVPRVGLAFVSTLGVLVTGMGIFWMAQTWAWDSCKQYLHKVPGAQPVI